MKIYLIDQKIIGQKYYLVTNIENLNFNCFMNSKDTNTQIKWIFLFSRISIIGVLIIALFKMPYGYYELLRLLTFAVMIFGGILSYSQKKLYWLALYCLFAIIYNPIIPVHLTREIWTYINIGTALFLIFSPTRKSNK